MSVDAGINFNRNKHMKKIALLKTALAASIAFASLTTMTGCFWGHDDHHDDRDHHDDHHDDHPDAHQDDHHDDQH